VCFVLFSAYVERFFRLRGNLLFYFKNKDVVSMTGMTYIPKWKFIVH